MATKKRATPPASAAQTAYRERLKAEAAARRANPEVHLPGPPVADSAASRAFDPDGDAAPIGVPPVEESGFSERFNSRVADGSIDPDNPVSFDDALLVDHEDGETEEQRQEKIARIRAKARPVGIYGQKLAYPERRGYKRHWFNDSPGRIEDALRAGWAFVKGIDGKSVSRNVDRGVQNRGVMGYIMEIPFEIWEDAMKARNAEATKRMAVLKANPFKAEAGMARPSDQGKFYSPDDSDPLKVEVR